MQSSHMNDLVMGQWGEMFTKELKEDSTQNLKKMYQSLYQEKEQQIKKETTNLPQGMRTPTALEIQQMTEYRDWYKQANPKASNRNIRRAICRKFNVAILPDIIQL